MFNKSKPVSLKIDNEKCTRCSKCIDICPADFLLLQDNAVSINENSMLGCIQCGHCMMSCPHDAIEIIGESISKENLSELKKTDIDFEKFHSFLLKRRSTRKFKQEEIQKTDLDKIIDAAATSAISLPPYEVKVLVISGKEKIKEFKNDILESFDKMSKKIWILNLFKPFMPKETYQMFKEFIIPLIKETLKADKTNQDILTYDAPAIILFYAPKYMGSEDSIIASTTATLAAESLNLGTCIIGSIPPAINMSDTLRKKYSISKKENVTTAMILGYPDHKFFKGINRKFKDIKFLN